MTTPDLVERLRGLASIALKAPMIAALTDAANEIAVLRKLHGEIIDVFEEHGFVHCGNAEGARTVMAGVRDEAIEECARWHEKQHADLASKPVWQILSSHLEYATALRALSQEPSK